jgi:chitodextrinase
MTRKKYFKKTASKSKKSYWPFKRNRHSGVIIFAVAFAVIGAYYLVHSFAAVAPPPSGGYFSIVPAGSFAALPNDSTAASMVHRSSWEPRPENNKANQTVAPSTFTTAGYSGMKNHAAVFGRVTGNFTGTTDEIIQWAAIKWGMPDDLLRAQAVVESSWYQNLKDGAGSPISGKGYGDFGHCGGSPAPSGYGTSGPSSFGLLQTKWCALKDASAAGYDGWPWSENSTAYNLDLYGAVFRGCYEGWDTWLGTTYTAGDMWGCVGRWYSGQWYSTDANSYISNVQSYYNTKPWRSWTDYGVNTPTPVADTAPPSTPLNLTATAQSTSQVNLSWSASTDNNTVSGYDVYRNESKLTTVASTGFNDTGLTAGTTYSYRVVAKDASGNLSPSSATVTVVTLASQTTPADTIAPVVSVTSPADASAIGRKVNIRALATDNVGVARMEIYIDGSMKTSTTSGTASYTWDAKKASRGLHTITVKATDKASNTGTKSIVVYK